MYPPTLSAPSAPVPIAGPNAPEPLPDASGAGTAENTLAQAGHVLSALESLPADIHECIFGQLDDPRDLAAVSATSRALRRHVLRQLDSAALTASLIHAADPATALREALPGIRTITPLALACAPLRAAALLLLRLPVRQRAAWQAQLSAIVAGRNFAPPLRARLNGVIGATAALTAVPPRTEQGVAAFDTLLRGAAGLPAAALDLLLPALAKGFWAGALSNQGFTGVRDARVPALFHRLLSAAATRPEARAIGMLVPLLLGMHCLYALDLKQAAAAAWATVAQLGPQNRPLGLVAMVRGMASIGQGDHRVRMVQDALEAYPPEVRDAAIEEVRTQVRSLIQDELIRDPG